MKILSLVSLLLVGFLSLAQIKSFDDLWGIDSEEAFIRVCFENGNKQADDSWGSPYTFSQKKDGFLHFSHSWTGSGRSMINSIDVARYNTKDQNSMAAVLFGPDNFKGDWSFSFPENQDSLRKIGKSNYHNILAEVKSICSFDTLLFDLISTYDCPVEEIGFKGGGTYGVRFKGKIAFWKSIHEEMMIGLFTLIS